MKTIEVTDEMYDALMEISKEMNTQDHRCTRMPYFFQVQEKEEIPAYDGDYVLFSHDSELELRDKEDKVEWLKEAVHERTYEFLGWEDEIEDIDSLDEDTLDDIIQECGFDIYYIQEKNIYSNAFFTSKACDEHIRINGHNLKKPSNFLTHAYRNPEMEVVSKFLCELSGGKLHT